MLIKLARLSLIDRRGSVLLSLLAMSVSIFVLLGVEHIRYQTKQNFSNTVSGVDLIVGARTSSLNLLLYSVFRIGSPTNDIRWNTYQELSKNKKVKWAIPISLGDSHRGYRVLGTQPIYFEHFRYGKQHPLTFRSGERFKQLFDVVLGSEVAKKLNYGLGDKITLSHGIAASSFNKHDKHAFTIVGILEPTGTPVDQTVHVSLNAIEAIHLDLQPADIEASDKMLQPKQITAVFLGLNSKLTVFQTQRILNEYEPEPLAAILPGVALTELWQMINILENTLLMISALVFIAACLGVSAMLLSSIRERQREIHLLRVMGAPPYFLFLLIELEALIITVTSCAIAVLTLTTTLLVLKRYLADMFGLSVDPNLLTWSNLYLLLWLVLGSTIIAAIPSISSYRRAQHS